MSSFNRQEKTISCLQSIFSQITEEFEFKVYLIDNGSDNTSTKVRDNFPLVNLYKGNSKLFWAGSMRRIWETAIKSEIGYDFFLLLNDDTILIKYALDDMWSDIQKLKRNEFILIGSTKDPLTNEISYGGSILLNRYHASANKLIPNNNPQLCHLGNGNVMLIPKETISRIGILSEFFTHGFADFDYTLRAKKNGIPSYIGSFYSGYCINDHQKNWWPAKEFTLRQRIKKLYDVKGLAYREYFIYLRLHFPYYIPQAWVMLWIKTLFPFFWEKFKSSKK